MKTRVATLAALAALTGLAGCAAGGAIPYMRSDVQLRSLAETGAGKITHVVYIVQENRSFDNMFQGYPGANTVSEGKNSEGKTIKLHPVTLGADYVIDHSADAMFAACHAPKGDLPGTHCRMDGFNNERSYNGPANPQYTYVPHDESRPYWDMAHEGALADNMFQSQLDESFVAHQYIIAAQAAWSVDLPPFVWGCGGGKYNVIATITPDRNPYGPIRQPCYDYQTLGDELDHAHLTWRFYASKYGSDGSGSGAEWSAYQAVRHIRYGKDWANVISPNWRFIVDVGQGKLANFTWITPVCDDSDHVNCVGKYGPSWVAALVNAVGESKFWDSTAIFIQWDDWGGNYDHVPPPYEDRDSLGFRVPLIMMSPYVRHDYISHEQYETASVLKFAENLFGLGQLAAADKRANSPAGHCFDFNQKPRPFVKIAAPKPPSFFIHHLPDDYFAPDYE